MSERTIILRATCSIGVTDSEVFADTFESRLAPVLLDLGLRSTSESGRKTIPGTYARLFAADGSKVLTELRALLGSNDGFNETLRDLGWNLGVAGVDGLLPFQLELYRADIGPGERTKPQLGSPWTTFNAADGLGSGFVMGIRRARDGTMWMATFGGGVTSYDGRAFEMLTERDGLANDQVLCVVQDASGHFWFGTEDGLSRYNGQTFTTYTTQDGLSHNRIRTVYQDSTGRIWIGTEEGLDYIEDDEVRNSDLLSEDLIGTLSIFEDSGGALWFGTYRGLVRYVEGSTRTLSVADGLADRRVWSIAEDEEGHMPESCMNLSLGCFGVM